ncbi:hypothetical protein B2G71_06005 [Novosphingobium sp. PC22D]|uniref:glycosyltransferase n=1 Tax=Novosphingobium sp. PC22D TaxID=1962403 RepID=UPI000BEF4B86|nr:glycosyltransferase [Novosphingobium sp. PC22D]PEQ13855.1 hypothetical protein B2G71_06005 [Novosphingobium sp. PC22D]
MTYVYSVIGFVAFVAFVFPYLVYPSSLLLFGVRRIRPERGADKVTFTLLFAAYNEERSLPQKIANVRELKRSEPGLQVVAYCDLSSDRTQEILEAASDVIDVIVARERTGKATGMARMVAQARGDVCVFTDANVLLDPSALSELREYFADPAIGGVAGSLIYTNDAESATARAGGLYWRLEEVIKSRESASGSIMGADGSIFATRRELYPTVPPHLLDDMIVSLSVVLAGKRLVYAPSVRAYERNTTTTNEEFRRKRRIACRAFNTHRYLWSDIRSVFGAAGLYKYFSHKVLRWFGLPLLVIALLAAAAALASSGHWLVLTGGLAVVVLCLALGASGIPPFALGLQVLIAICATFLGVIDALAGRTYQTWTPAASRDTLGVPGKSGSQSSNA